MAAPTLAFGELHLFSLPDGRYLYGREFELLPAGTMFAASVILSGLVGVAADVDGNNVARVARDAEIEVFSTRGTDPDELNLHNEDVREAFQLKQLQDAQG